MLRHASATAHAAPAAAAGPDSGDREAGMIDPEPIFYPFDWPRGSFRQWLVALATVAALIGLVYLLLSWLGW
jgi:hypothetical protein